MVGILGGEPGLITKAYIYCTTLVEPIITGIGLQIFFLFDTLKGASSFISQA